MVSVACSATIFKSLGHGNEGLLLQKEVYFKLLDFLVQEAFFSIVLISKLN